MDDSPVQQIFDIPCRVARGLKQNFAVLPKKGCPSVVEFRVVGKLRRCPRLTNFTGLGVLILNYGIVLSYLRVIEDFAALKHRCARHVMLFQTLQPFL